MDKFISAEENADAEMTSSSLEDIFVTDFPDLFLSQSDVIRLVRPIKGARLITPEVLPVLSWILAVKENIKVWSGIFGIHAGEPYARIYINDCFGFLCQYFPAMGVTSDWIMFEVFGEIKSSIIDLEKYHNQGAQSVLSGLWSGPDGHIQSQLLRQHADEADWPAAPLFARALAAFAQCASFDVSQLLTNKTSSVGGLFWSEPEDYRYMVANLPVLLGFWSMTGAPMTWWHRQRRLAVVEQVRLFNPQWFALAYQHGVMLAVVMGHHYRAKKEE